MALNPLTLFVDAFFSNRFDLRCYVTLVEKDLDFAVSRVMVTEGQGLSPGYKEKSLTARVPGLVHGEFWLAESLAIVEYLEDTFPAPEWPSVYPADPHKRARARQVLAFLGSDLETLIDERPSWAIFYPCKPPPLTPLGRAEANELLALGERLVAEGLFDEWSIASADLAFALMRLSRTGEVLPPRLQALVDSNLARPSVKGYMTHDRPPNPPRTGRRAAT